MPGANEGAAARGGQAQSLGIRVDLPFEQDVNAFAGMAFEHRTFFTRLHQFVLASDAFIVAPGGIGTVLERVMIWKLLQVRHLTETPRMRLLRRRGRRGAPGASGQWLARGRAESGRKAERQGERP